MKLNYLFRISQSKQKTLPIVLIHGLFGSLSNLGTIASYLIENHDILQVDLRNHGYSFHHHIMTYHSMAQDILDLLDDLMIPQCIVIGHSMGGKIAMILSIFQPKRFKKIIVIDIAPIQYDTMQHNNILKVIDYVHIVRMQNKNTIVNFMQHVSIPKYIILFLLKSFRKGKWIFNVKAIKKNYVHIHSWPIHITCKNTILFIRGSLSTYIKNSYITNIYNQFPNARIHTVSNSGHWVHYDNLQHVLNIINKFILY